MKTPAHFALIKLELKAMEDRLAYPLDPIADDMFGALGVALETAPDDETAAQLKSDWLAARPHLFKTIVAIPRDELEAAFGSSPTLAAQGAIMRYGQASVEAAAKSWGTSLGSLKPGRDPDASGEKSTKKAAPSGDVPSVSKNPWSTGWRAPRPPKDEADRQRMRLAAQTEIIKSFGAAGATRYARCAGKQINGLPLRVKP